MGLRFVTELRLVTLRSYLGLEYAACMSPEFFARPDIVYPRITVPQNYERRKVWLFRALDEQDNRRATSGLLYDDDIDSHYSYSNQVPNSRQVKEGDLVLVRDNQVLLGAAVIQEITEQEQTVERLQCPICGNSKMYWRKNRQDWRCDGACLRPHKLDADARSTTRPIVAQETTTMRTARYGDTWSDLAGAMLASEMEQLAERWNKQNSIVELNPQRVSEFFSRLQIAVRATLGPDELESRLASGGFSERAVRTRRGQTQFRAHLVNRFGSVCAFSGPCFLAALDAAHLYSYAEHGEHRRNGGLLLRRDLHTLFDRGYLAVDRSLRVVIHQELESGQYRVLHGRNLGVEIGQTEKALLATHFDRNRDGLLL